MPAFQHSPFILKKERQSSGTLSSVLSDDKTVPYKPSRTEADGYWDPFSFAVPHNLSLSVYMEMGFAGSAGIANFANFLPGSDTVTGFD